MIAAAVVPHWAELYSSSRGFLARVVAGRRVLAVEEGTAAVCTEQGWFVAGWGDAAVLENGRPRPLHGEDVPAPSPARARAG